ncbi:MAG: hypothetical protein QM758_05820 [Armatimonas sp.]
MISRKGSSQQYLLFKFDRFISWSFSKDERFLVMNNALGSGECDVEIFKRISSPPFYRKVETVDPIVWSVLWQTLGSREGTFRKKYPAISKPFPDMVAEDHHNYTCMVKWLDSKNILMYLMGNGSIDSKEGGDSLGSWELGPGFFFIFNCATLQLSQTNLTKKLNKGTVYKVTARH